LAAARHDVAIAGNTPATDATRAGLVHGAKETVVTCGTVVVDHDAAADLARVRSVVANRGEARRRHDLGAIVGAQTATSRATDTSATRTVVVV
jgi:hypothetical protein